MWTRIVKYLIQEQNCLNRIRNRSLGCSIPTELSAMTVRCKPSQSLVFTWIQARLKSIDPILTPFDQYTFFIEVLNLGREEYDLVNYRWTCIQACTMDWEGSHKMGKWLKVQIVSTPYQGEVSGLMPGPAEIFLSRSLKYLFCSLWCTHS